MRRLIIIILTVFILSLIIFISSVLTPREVALTYLNIINISSGNESINNELLNIVPDDVKASVIENSKVSNTYHKPYPFKVHSVKTEVLGLEKYRFTIHWTINKFTTTKTLFSAIIVEKNIVINAYRVDS